MKLTNVAVILVSILPLALGGCVEAPPRKLETGERFIFETGQTPYSAAICIARNARRQSQGIEAQERLLEESSMEVLVRSGGETLAVAQVRRAGIKSEVSILVSPAVGADRGQFARKLMTDC